MTNYKLQIKNYFYNLLLSIYNSQKGQSLLEVTVLVGLALITVTGLVIVTINGLKNSQYSQNQAQATKLAQQGMDQVKGMVSRNCAVNIGGSYLWFNSKTNGTDLVWAKDWSTSPKFRITNYNGCSDASPGLTQTTAANPDDINQLTTGGIFIRDITMSDDSSCTQPTSCKVLTVRVFWTDYSGDHESKLVTILTEN